MPSGLLARRTVTSELLTGWQELLLLRDGAFADWKALMQLRGQLRRLEVVAESQLDAVDEWRDQTSLVLDAAMTVRFNDPQEHMRRVYASLPSTTSMPWGRSTFPPTPSGPMISCSSSRSYWRCFCR